MVISKFSKKQAEILKFIYSDDYAIVCDGAVRSGKTISMILAFVIWSMDFFDKMNFGICGKTIQATERNVIKELEKIEGLSHYRMTYNQKDKMLTIKCGNKENYYYVFGGKDESSYSVVQGITLGGVFFDEVALQPKSFVEQAIARTLSIENAKLWFNCNPENPDHWFKKEWIDENKDKVKVLHFLMEDNPIMTKDKIEKAEKMYNGVFYDRYIKGLWCRAEGLIYQYFADNKEKFYCKKEDLEKDKDGKYVFSHINIGLDWGGNGSRHALQLTGINKTDLYFLKSKCIDAKGVTPDDMYKQMVEFIEECLLEFGRIDCIYADSAEQTLINGLRARVRIPVKNAIKGEIINRIRATNIMMSIGKLHILKDNCQDLISFFLNAVYDEKKQKDTRLDDGSYNNDIGDASEYSWEAFINLLIKYVGA